MKSRVLLAGLLLNFHVCILDSYSAVPWIEGVVSEVVDGDTIKAILNFKTEKAAEPLGRGVTQMTDDHYTRPGEYMIALSQIDAPELAQSYGKDAQKNLAAKILHKNVRIVEENSQETAGPLTARVWYQDKNKKWLDLNRVLVSEGMAWAAEHAMDGELKEMENQARKANKGVFTDDKPMPPWIFRKRRAYMRRPSPSWINCAGQRKSCRQMKTCEQAVFYFERCFHTELDPDGNGIPCENTVCGGAGAAKGASY